MKLFGYVTASPLISPAVCRNSREWRDADIYAGHVHHARSF